MLENIKARAVSRFTINLNTDVSNSIFLAGVGRSGTTWISDIINYKNEYRYMFEPFNSRKVSICRHFRYRQYLRPQNREMTYLKTTEKILSGQIRDHWIDFQNKKLFARKRLIKAIRANLLLKWLKHNFPDVPIILLLRHPCAVASSKLKLSWETHLEEFLGQEELVVDYLLPFKKEIEKARDDFEKHVFLWCIENYVPMKQFKAGQIHLAFYENYCTDAIGEIKRLFHFLGKSVDDWHFTNAHAPSRLCRKDSAVITGDSLTDNWRKYITTGQIRRTMDILNMFGLDRIYSEESTPNVKEAYKALQENS